MSTDNKIQYLAVRSLGPVKRKWNCSNFSISQDIWSLYPSEWKSKFVAKLARPFWPAISAQPALPGFPGRATWAEIAGQNGLANLATNLDYHSVGYRGHISCDIEKLEQFHFRLTGPNEQLVWYMLGQSKIMFMKIVPNSLFFGEKSGNLIIWSNSFLKFYEKVIVILCLYQN